ncbi:MAG: tetratricopeptide repeat protein [bacterium]|nr:tetratricopeptide repeat protein [bacterium]
MSRPWIELRTAIGPDGRSPAARHLHAPLVALILARHLPTPLVALVLVSASAQAIAAATDRDRVLAWVAEGRCESALPDLRSSPPGTDLELWWARAVCENATGNPMPALEAARAASALGLESAELALQEGIAQFQLGDLAAADAALAIAARGDASPPERLLYQGLVALGLRRPAEASRAFDAARKLDPIHVEPVASFYAGHAQAELGQLAEARIALERVQQEWPDTPWAEQAGQTLAALDAEHPGPWLLLELGGEYDDNAVLRGAGVRLPEEIQGQQDTRFSWRAQAGADFWSEGPWSLAGMLDVNGQLHDELNEFDTAEPLLTLWLDRSFGTDTLARFELSTSYAWVDGDPFRTAHAAGFTLHHAWSERAATSLRMGIHLDDYRFSDDDVADGPGHPGTACLDPGDIVCSPRGIDESRDRNRDGQGSWIGVIHEFSLGEGISAWGGYRFHRYSARGQEYSFDSHGWELGARVALPARFDLEASGHYAFREFRHPSTFPEPDSLIAGLQYGLSRSDHSGRLLQTRLVLGRALGQRVRIEARWIHQRVRSNVSVFDYRRDQFGGFVILALGSIAGGAP